MNNPLGVSPSTAEPRFNEVAGDRPNLFVKWRVRYIENLDTCKENLETTRGKEKFF